MEAIALFSESFVTDPFELPETPTIADSADVPAWVDSVARKLIAFLSLEQGWDSYDALPPTPEAVVSAYELLSMVADSSTPAPEVIPAPAGGVQLEWHMFGIDLEVEIRSAFRFGVYYENQTTGEVREEELMADLTPLRAWVGSLSK